MSNREKKIAIILLGLAVLWAYVFFSRHVHLPKADGHIMQVADEISAKPTALAGPLEGSLKRMIEKVFLKFETKESSAQLIDPFKKFDARDLMDRSVLEFSELKLIGIVIDQDITAALINDDILYIGDEISGFKVVEIRPNEVFLTRGLEKYTLKLFEEP